MDEIALQYSNTQYGRLLSMDSISWKRLCQIRQFMLVHMYHTENDNWIWSATTSGRFTYQSACNAVRQPSTIFELAPVVCYPHHSHKMSACLLRALQDKLLTKARLRQFGIINHDTCVLCNTSPESIQHLFFSCTYSSYI